MKRVLSIGTHPDDIEIGCGGTEAKLKAQGFEIIHVVATLGEQGSLTISPEDLAKKRKMEARESGKKLGASSVIFLDLADGLTGFTEEDKMSLIKLVRELKPEIVFTHARCDHFPDHRVVNALTEAALLAARGPWYPGAGGTPHEVSKVFGYEVWNPMNTFQTSVNITDFMEQKIDALKCHASQLDDVNYVDAITGLALYRGAMSMTGKFAEVFEVLFSKDVL